jgi:ribonuclease P protein component
MPVEANVSSPSQTKETNARIPGADADPGGTGHPCAASAQRSEAAIGVKRGEESFPKSSRLRRGSEIRRVIREGRRWKSPAFIVYAGRSDGERSRLGLIVGRRTGNAVERNRAKRILRETFRRMHREIKDGTDLVVRTGPLITARSSREIADDFRKALENTGVLCRSPSRPGESETGPNVGQDK